MGVYIKGMEMPKNCYQCRMVDSCQCLWKPYDLDDYSDLQDMIEEGFTRADNCPLVEIPPHGRLGDLDKLEKMFADIDSAPYSCFDGAEPFYSAEDAVHIIRLAPTIIPASGEGE